MLQGSAVVSTTSASPGTVAEAFQKRENTEAEEPKEPKGAAQGAVSYTHLTLPTIYSV